MSRVKQENRRRRFNLEIDELTIQRLKNLTERTGAASMTEAIRRAIALHDLISRLETQGFKSLVAKNDDGKERELLVV